MAKQGASKASHTVVNFGGAGISKYGMKHESYFENIGSAVLYGFCSTSMAFANKAIISSFQFDYPFFIMACQMILCICFFKVMIVMKFVEVPMYTLKLGKVLALPSLFYGIHSITALHALEGMSIPMYAAVKRCAPIITLILSVILLHKKIPSFKVILSVFFITVGCILASFGDLKFDLSSYTYGAVSVVVQGLYLTLSQKSLQSLTALDVLYINSWNTVPLFIILTAYFELHNIIKFTNLDASFLACFGLQTSLGVLLNYSLFYCTSKNSALTTSLVGVLKSVLQTIIGLFTFGGIDLNILNAFGISLNLFGGILYTSTKYQENKVKNVDVNVKPV